MIIAMATILSTIFLFDMYALIISIVAWSIMYCIKVMVFLKTCTLALITNSPVKGLIKHHMGLASIQGYQFTAVPL